MKKSIKLIIWALVTLPLGAQVLSAQQKNTSAGVALVDSLKHKEEGPLLNIPDVENVKAQGRVDGSTLYKTPAANITNTRPVTRIDGIATIRRTWI